MSETVKTGEKLSLIVKKRTPGKEAVV